MKMLKDISEAYGMGEHMELVDVVSQVGFPIAVAVYTLVVLNKTVQKNTEETQKNTSVTNQLLLMLTTKKGD